MDNDCLRHPYRVCVLDEDESTGLCAHKGVFPIYNPESIGLLVLAIMIALANVGGIGGGGLIIPIIMAFFKFTTKEAIAISGFTIFTGSLTRFLYSWKQKHPEKDATVIDYGIVIVMLPLVLVGSFVGVLFNIVLPSVVLSVMLTVVLGLLTFQSGMKALQMYRRESVVNS